ncbi:zinc finger CCCH domain-containing protein 18-like isoform X1 [Macrosteles quadrilineatus]|uniref:zinc finger CCCH domain-containing protein 18-like isoform X1 n=1 Tax=Macrosteles quadrilineatus TaxID=74068 RepID=UPI0023E22CE8|nr:zinc finger CCCH domain-containing protein 18-like isoform X1 [Macrosteles quadrilineatus]XP_054287234.1 zinc finger CCCH domain-containing protein 18-like isoform X1 [Macrosteles quadrilineatus]
MDSDSSLDEEHYRGRNQGKQEPIPVRPNVEDNSDVSDEENISRAARSIESPPESPQGTHFESPPASPDPENKPGTPSPIQSPDDSASYGSPARSPDSQNGSRPPRSPDSFHPRSPKSPRSPSPQFANRSPPSDHERGPRSPTTNYPRSPSPTSPSSPHSRKSPPQSPAPRSSGIRSPSPNSNSIRSPSPYRNRSVSPRSQSSPTNVSSPTRFKGRRTPSNSPQSNRSPPPQRTRKDSMSDDGRSNISSASSFGSPRQSPARPRTPPEKPQNVLMKSHVEDLSDVSDLESLNSMSDEETEKPPCKENGEVRASVNDSKPAPPVRNNTSTTGLEGDDTEQLDFEAEDKEEGECDVTRPKAPDTEAVLSEDEGELKGDELEEGEITDEGENRPEETEPRPICRFYNRGQCTWGSSCRFVHPGVTDKGNYTMFEMVRPLVPVNNGPPPIYGPPMDPYRPIDRPVIPMGPPVYQQPIISRKEEPVPVVESAWERGLRQAKEMLRKSSKRKETEVDFEEKKMNLSLGQDDLDKENDYYTRPASPVMIDEPDRWGSKAEPEAKRYRTMSDRFDDYGGGAEGIYYPRSTEQVWHQRPHYDESMRAVFSSRSSSSKYYARGSREKEYYQTPSSSSSKRQKYSQREVIVQRPEKTNWKEDTPPAKPSRYTETRGGGGGRGDEWADPWMRKKTSSPLTRKRKASYSSGSSYSSSSSSHSSHSSSSSYSRSRSRSSRSRSRSKPVPPRRLLRPTSPAGRGGKVALSPALLPEKKITTGSILMNPPPPSPRGKNKNMAANPSPPVDRPGPGVPARLLAHSKAASAVAAAMRSARSRSKSSRSSGSSDSSGSSSDSSESSFSSSSSSRPVSPSPPVRQKRIVIDERERLALATAMKVKAMDALKLSGQKQQIKLTLKGAGDRTAAPVPSIGKKRLAESPPMEFSPPKAGTKTTPKKAAPSRREELLKQLKAVEDAIARKRSKIS